MIVYVGWVGPLNAPLPWASLCSANKSHALRFSDISTARLVMWQVYETPCDYALLQVGPQQITLPCLDCLLANRGFTWGARVCKLACSKHSVHLLFGHRPVNIDGHCHLSRPVRNVLERFLDRWEICNFFLRIFCKHTDCVVDRREVRKYIAHQKKPF